MGFFLKVGGPDEESPDKVAVASVILSMLRLVGFAVPSGDLLEDVDVSSESSLPVLLVGLYCQYLSRAL